MRDIKSLFGKYASLGLSDKRGKEAFIKAVQEVLSVTLTIKQITVNKKEVTLQVPSALRYAIKNSEKEILKKMESLVGTADVYHSIR